MPISQSVSTSRRAVTSPTARFAAINRERLRRVRDCLPPHQQVLLELLPLLFHVNHPLLPGYVGQDTPNGVSDYHPGRDGIAAAKRIAKSFSFDRRVLRQHPIQGLYLMGSAGTVAHSRDSDFDIWLCHTLDAAASGLEQLQRKAHAIETWAAELGLEVHFFLLQAERFKRGETLRLSAESSGSSQFHLLLDEFYRSGLVLAGLQPLWWRVPPDQEHRYEEFIEEQHFKRLLDRGQFIDFGGLSRIAADEFFGASIWQLSKSIGAPYKSVQKLLLLESYAHEYPSIDLLSSRYKRAVYAGDYQLNQLDPYLSMYHKIEEYLTAQGERTRLEVLRRSFYLKTGVRLSQTPIMRDPSWRREAIQQLATEWSWPPEALLHLDRQERWDFDAVSRERHDLVRVLTRCYTRLSEFARRHAENSRITQDELNVIGRKLYAAFERKPGKIDLVNQGITADLYEEQLSLHQMQVTGQAPQWALFRGLVAGDAAGQATPINRSPSLIALVAWAHFNKLYRTGSSWHLFANDSPMTRGELSGVLRCLEQMFPGAAPPAASSDSLSRAPRITRAILFTNIGIDPMRTRIRDGNLLTSNASDAFQFSGQRINLALTFDLVITTSWGEIFSFNYQGLNGLMQAMLEYLRWSPLPGHEPPPAAQVFCFSSQYAALIERRVQALFDTARRIFFAAGGAPNRQLVIEAEQRYYRLFIEDHKPRSALHESYTSLLTALGQPGASFCQVEFDAESLSGSPLPVIYPLNRPDSIQVFIETGERKAKIYVLDEQGSLFTQTHESRSIRHIYSHFAKFFAAVLRHVQFAAGSEPPADLPVTYFRLEKTANQRYLVHQLDLPEAYEDYMQIQVLGDIDASDNRHYTIYCDQVEFSTARHGNRVFAAAASHVMQRRAQGDRYPVYITGIDLSRALLAAQGVDRLQTTHLLGQKKRLEFHLTRALEPQSS